MKLSYALIGLAAASAMPTATAFAADEATFTGKGVPYAIEIDASVQPASITHTAYPQAAGMRMINGSCDVRFSVAADGAPSAVEVMDCTSELFRTEAARIAEGLRFTSASDHTKANIRWTIAPSEAVVTTASLR